MCAPIGRLWAGYREWNWSEGEFMGGLLASMLTALIAGSIWTWRMRQINALTGNRWRLILTGSVGRALVRLARLGLTPRPAEPQRSPVDHLMRGALLRELRLGGVRVSALRQVVNAEYRLTDGQQGSPAALELEELRLHAKDQLKPLEDSLERLLAVDAASADLQSLTTDLEAIQQVGIAVDHLIARHRALMGNGMHLIK
ncbi:MAG: hypothetical protein HY700_01990 [Gemmatimonadetes bacterium]|nr:hypothetical protein [Gemmatimonadota bacterium]